MFSSAILMIAMHDNNLINNLHNKIFLFCLESVDKSCVEDYLLQKQFQFLNELGKS